MAELTMSPSSLPSLPLLSCSFNRTEMSGDRGSREKEDWETVRRAAPPKCSTVSELDMKTLDHGEQKITRS